jgi:hypothetical protein
MASARVDVHRDVSLAYPDQWHLHFQWGTYHFDDGRLPLDGYRFIWEKADGTFQPARAQARIPSADDLFQLLSLACREGWFRVCEVPASAAGQAPGQQP